MPMIHPLVGGIPGGSSAKVTERRVGLLKNARLSNRVTVEGITTDVKDVP